MFQLTVGQRLAIAGFLIKFSAKVLSLYTIIELINWEKLKPKKIRTVSQYLFSFFYSFRANDGNRTRECWNHNPVP